MLNLVFISRNEVNKSVSTRVVFMMLRIIHLTKDYTMITVNGRTYMESSKASLSLRKRKKRPPSMLQC